MATQDLTAAGVQLTESAVARVRQLVDEGKVASGGGLRLAVQGGGCSGLSYAVRFEAKPASRDKVFEFDGSVRVFVDPKSLIYLAGMVVNYKNDLMQQGFVFSNPNAQKSCGCGSSFSS